ncbi:MAG: c-type cytochrome, partial [Candidatus Binatia bacterium]
EGKDLTVQLCNTCHNLQKTVVSRKSPQEWEKTVYDMVARGAQIFPDEAEQIVKYLATSFPPGK